MQLEAPAKINLWLRVRGRREDGFHEIESLFLPVDLADTLIFQRTAAGGIELVCDDPSLPTGPENLVVKAAALFRERTAIQGGIHIQLRKRIPHGAGLGGGSSDAAATLRGLNELFETGRDQETLSAWGAELGSDVPFFVQGRPAICRGRGERITPAEFPEKLTVLLLKPPFSVPTPWAYQRWRDAREIPGGSYAAQPGAWGESVNDLERPVFEKFIFLAFVKGWLLEQPESLGALMSGSGSTMFAILPDKSSGEVLAARAKRMFGETLWTRVCEAG